MMSGLTKTWIGLIAVGVVAFLVLWCSPAEAWNAIYVEITSPNSGASIRGHNRSVSVHAWTTGALKLKTIKVLYNDVLKWSHTYDPAVTEKYDSGSFCTFEIANTNGVLKAKAYAEDGQTYAMDTQTNPVDNAYLISVTRGTCATPGTVRWRYWTGTAWSTLSNYCVGGHPDTSCPGWGGTTQGGARTGDLPDGYCRGPGAPQQAYCSHPVNYPNHAKPNCCHNGDTPGFTGSGREYPTIGGTGDPVCDSNYGRAWIVLGSATADCGCSRTGIWIHGKGIGDDCPATHDWYPTLGCVRMQNGQVQTLYNIVNAAYGRVGYDDIHVSVPHP